MKVKVTDQSAENQEFLTRVADPVREAFNLGHLSAGGANLRIEALRAAAQITAAGLSGQIQLDGRDIDAEAFAISLADQFVRWLETGER